MKIGQASHASGLEPSAIRFYESAGVLPRAVRTGSGYRDYAAKDVELLSFVRALRALQLPLDDVREIVELRNSGQPPCQSVRVAIEREAAAIDSRIEELHQLRTELGELEKTASHVEDDWPRSCVCHVIESSGKATT